MSDKYPIPAYACNLWVAGDNLMVAFPGTLSEQGHTIKLPASAGGLQVAINILKDRSAASDLRIGNDGTPTQYTAEQFAGRAWGTVAKRMRTEREARIVAENERKMQEHTAQVRRKAREKEEAAEFLKELGL